MQTTEKLPDAYRLKELLNPACGLADDDESPLHDVNADDEAAMRQMFREVFIPYFREQEPSLIPTLKEIWRAALNDPNATPRLERAVHSMLASELLPDDPRCFFVWLWEECFPGEAYSPAPGPAHGGRAMAA